MQSIGKIMVFSRIFKNEKKLRPKITPTLYGNFPATFLLSVFASTVVFWDYPIFSDIKSDLNWFFLFLSVWALRWITFVWYQYTKSSANLINYHFYVFVIGSSVSACAWGVLGSFFMPNDFGAQMLTLLVIVGIIGASIHALYVSFLASSIYIIMIFVPISIWLYLQESHHGEPLFFVILSAITIFCGYILSASYKSNKVLLSSINFNIEKTKMINEIILNETRLRQSEQQYRDIVELSPYGIIIVVDDKIRYINKSMLTMLHAVSEQQVLGESVLNFIDPVYHSVVSKRHKNLQVRKKYNDSLEEKFITLDGVEIDVNVKSIATTYLSHFAIQLFVEDISERNRIENKYSYLSLHDPLTGLINRNRFEETVDVSLPFAKQAKDMLCIFLINLDKFRSINDSYGVEMSNLVLQEIAKRIAENSRKIDSIAKFPGDEFCIVIHMIKTNEEVKYFANKIMSLFSDDFEVNEKSIHINVSMGVSKFPDDGNDSITLIENANIAMHAAKIQGGNCFKFYNIDLKTSAVKRGALEEELRSAVLEDEFFMLYQPKVSLITEKIVGLEALIRWNKDSNKIETPNNFIALIEKIDLINPLTKLIINKVLEQNHRWQTNHKFLALLKTSINISANNLKDDDVMNFFINAVKQYNVDPSFLEIEITESSLIENLKKGANFLKRLKSLGVSVSIDDFGTGYSSLYYLNHLRVDTIKIDKSFINNIIDDYNNLAIVKAIIAMAHQLEMEVIAEGVETREQFKLLQELNCDQVQGYYISPPLKVEDLELFIKNFNIIK